MLLNLNEVNFCKYVKNSHHTLGCIPRPQHMRRHFAWKDLQPSPRDVTALGPARERCQALRVCPPSLWPELHLGRFSGDQVLMGA